MKIQLQELILTLPSVAEDYCGSPAGHIKRLKNLTEILTGGMIRMFPGSVSRELAGLVVRYAPLHDVGKRFIPQRILKKTAPLTAEEYEIIKTHTTKGAVFLKENVIFPSESDLSAAVQIAEFHHEKYDGSGYPHGLIGEQIPMAARLMTPADVYDALRSERPYKCALGHEESVKIILEGDGRTKPGHFDPKVLEVFKALEGEVEKLYSNTGQLKH